MKKEEIVSYLNNISLVLFSLLLLIFPMFFLSITTESFNLPKQLLVTLFTVAISLTFFARMVVEKKVSFKLTPFNLPLLIFGGVIFVSALLSTNKYDSLLAAIPVILIVFLSFLLVQFVENKFSLQLLVYSLLLGASISALYSIFNFLKIYILPFSYAQNPYFTPFGSGLPELLYFIPLLILALYNLIKAFEDKNINSDTIIYSLSSILLGMGVVLATYQTFFSQNKVLILPYLYGFQISLATISQEAQRFVYYLLFGSGYGTFLNDFLRFKLPSYNMEKDLWSLTFSTSSSYFLELIATTGILGMLAFLFLGFKLVKSGASSRNVLFLPVFSVFALALIAPFSYSSVFILFVLLGLYIAYLSISKDKKIAEYTLTLVALKKGLLEFAPEAKTREESTLLPGVFSLVGVLLLGFVAFWAVKYTVAEAKITESLGNKALNNGQAAYNLQRDAINTFPYKSDYYRTFSQVNFALANSLASNQGKTPSADVQKYVLTLIQQSIDSGKTAVVIAPANNTNWISLAQIYRNLIKVGQNAEQFTVATLQQAIALDPSNPQLYIELGGVYFQLGQYELAQSQFQIAVNLKSDFANAYYNLGHAMEAKGDYKGALQQYQVVRSLSAASKENLDKIDNEIKTIEAKVGEQDQQAKQAQEKTSSDLNNQPLNVNNGPTPVIKPSGTVKIPPPPGTSTTPTPTASGTPSASPTPTVAK